MKTFLDSGVLMCGWKGEPAARAAALTFMADDRRQFFTSAIVKLELLPKAHYHRQRQELDFYNSHFAQAGEAHLSLELEKKAGDLAQRYGLAAADALNVSAAILLEAAEFVTSELPGKPIFRVREIKVISLHQ